MNLFTRLAIASLGALLFVLSPTHAQTERITDFVSTIEVQSNGDLLVTEEISVVANGDAIRRGIFRDFPTDYRSRYGLNVVVAFEVSNVFRDGDPEPWSIKSEENGTRVYIGNPDANVPTGPHTYTIQYRTDRQLVLGEDGFDELYWNVTGNGWDFPIEQALARVILPDGATVRSAEGYTGASGAQGTAWQVTTSPGADAALETTAPLAPHEGFTISVTWPKGFIDANANREDFGSLLVDNWPLVLAVITLPFVFLYFFIAWWLVGRDPPRGTIIPHFEPPAGVGPAAARYIVDLGRFDNTSFAASVIQLAVAGAVLIQKAATYSLTPSGKTDGLSADQREFFDALLGSRGTLDFDSSNHAIFSQARGVLLGALKKKFGRDTFSLNTGIWVGGVLLSLVPIGLTLLNSPDSVVSVFLGAFFVGWTFGVLAVLRSARTAFRAGRWVAGIITSLFALPFIATWFFVAFLVFAAASFWTMLVFGVVVGLVIVFRHLLKAPTRRGRAIIDHLEGFRHYLGVAEADRLELENPPERTPALFEQFLPYALALDVEQRWAEQFTDVFASVDYQPDWYEGGNFHALGATAFASSLGSGFSSAIASASTAPGSSSGSGGGGSSGGGGGGGGGGGW